MDPLDIYEKLILSFFMALGVSMMICEILKNKKEPEPAKFSGYDDKTNKFHCPQCGREISMQATFFEVCPFCRDSY